MALSVRDWLRSVRAGICSRSPSTQERAELGFNDCDTGDRGTWLLSSAITTEGWEGVAAHCLSRCKRCARCRSISLSTALDRCVWHQSCGMHGLVRGKLEDNYRTAPLPGGTIHAVAATNMSVSDAERWLARASPGACHFSQDRARDHSSADCEFGHQGKLPVWGAVGDDMKSLAHACLSMCVQLGSCSMRVNPHPRSMLSSCQPSVNLRATIGVRGALAAAFCPSRSSTESASGSSTASYKSFRSKFRKKGLVGSGKATPTKRLGCVNPRVQC